MRQCGYQTNYYKKRKDDPGCINNFYKFQKVLLNKFIYIHLL